MTRYQPKKSSWKNDHVNVAAMGYGSSEPEIPRIRTAAELESDRIGAEEWERSKLMHPEPAGPTKEEIERDEVNKTLENWPWQGLPNKLVTLAPHLMNWKYEFEVPGAKQESSRLLELLNIRDYGNIIFPMVLELHSDACNFASTSYRSSFLMKQYIGYWDINFGWFGNCDLQPGTVGTGGVSDRPGNVDQILIVTPVREARLKYDPIYAKQLENVFKFCKAVNNFAGHFRNLQLHRIPFLTPDLLGLLIPKMTRLEVLGVYKCPLIHVGHTLQLLDIIKTDRPQEIPISFDFFPRLHTGPVHKTDTARFRTGNYGVTWDSWLGNSVLAIWSLMTRILPKAAEQGVHLIEKDKMFRKWLDMTPCVNIDAILAAIMDYTMDPHQLVATIDFYNYSGSVRKLTKKVLNKPEGYEWMLEEHLCGSCDYTALGMFYFYNHIRLARNDGTLGQTPSILSCLGCLLVEVLDNENDHFNLYKSLLVKDWVKGAVVSDSVDLEKGFYLARVKAMAHELELRREDHIREFQYDKETEERQKPLNANLKYPEKYLSPRYEEKVIFERPVTNFSSQFGNVIYKQDRYWGHGHGGLD